MINFFLSYYMLLILFYTTSNSINLILNFDAGYGEAQGNKKITFTCNL